eukprot:SM001583S02107  [mRNA]  locus=s1583:1186:1746:- [translate_table: standard]
MHASQRGISAQVLYHFANAEGSLAGLSLPCYFGFASDLYHFGHFALKFRTRYAALLGLQEFRIVALEHLPEAAHASTNNAIGAAEARVEIVDRRGVTAVWRLQLSRAQRGRLPPCWLTDSFLPSTVSSKTKPTTMPP